MVTEAFRKFGEHCARNQIRTLLIDCLVMTNLFYPSLALYLPKRFPPPSPRAVQDAHWPPLDNDVTSPYRTNVDHPLSFSTLGRLFPSAPPLLPRLTWAGWWGSGTREREDDGWTATRAIPGAKEIGEGQNDQVWVMRIGWADVEDVLDRHIEDGERKWEERDHHLLKLVQNVAENWERQIPSNRQRCVRQLKSSTSVRGDGVDSEPPPCYVLTPSPDAFDSAIPISMSGFVHFDHGVSASPDSVPLGRSPNPDNIYHTFAALFHVPQNSTSAFEQRWQSAMSDVAKEVEGEVFVEAKGPRVGDQIGEWFISYASSPLSQQPNLTGPISSDRSKIFSSSPPPIIIVLYVILFTTLIVQLSNASKAHSRFGLAFTGVVQLCCSSVMSFSILALLGWNGWGVPHAESSLPTYVLPFVIVVVGAENMSTLTQAIFSIPFTHSVPVRIGLGLSKVGTTIALTSLTDLGILSVVWLCVNLQPVREFCLFAAVVIVTDWFMLHTFFLTVLSIDAQRLELADVLASNKVGMVSPVESTGEKDAQNENQGFLWRNMLRARTTKSGSLLLLLFTVGLLYWLTERHRSPLNTTASLYGYTPTARSTSVSVPTPTASPFVSTPEAISVLSSAEKLWRALNPEGWPFAHVIVPPASILVLPKFGHSMRPGDIRKLSLPASRLLIPRLKALFYIFKVLVLPQAITAGALYALLLYLLKDADLLDAQRNRLGRMGDAHEDESDFRGSTKNASGLLNCLRARMLPCSHEADVDVIASSSDGRIAISVAIDNSVCLWRFLDTPGSGTREPLPTGGLDGGDAIVAAAVSEDGQHVAVCTNMAVVQIWEVPREGAVVPLQVRKPEQTFTAKILGIAFDETAPNVDDPFTANEPATEEARKATSIMIGYGDGSVMALTEMDAKVVIPAQDRGAYSSCRVLFMREIGGSVSILIARQHDIDIWRKSTFGWVSSSLIADLPGEDRVTALSPLNAELPGVFAVGRRSGNITIYDESHGQLELMPQGSSIEGVRKIQLVRPSSMKCLGCGLQSAEGYAIISSTSSQVSIDRIAPRTSIPTFCRCTRRVSSADDVPALMHRSDSPQRSKPNSLIVPPVTFRQRPTPGSSPHKSISLLSPVSNGEFPLSSHGSARRSSNFHREDDSLKIISSPHDRSALSSIGGGSGLVSPSGDMEVTSLGGISAQGASDGGWAILDGDVLVGVRRGREGIDDAQWQVWSVDMTAPWDMAGLVVDSIDLSELQRRTFEADCTIRGQASGGGSTNGVVSMRDRRTERLLSLNGRASFPERVGSFAVPTYESLGYVEVVGLNILGTKGMIGGFGNRLGTISLERFEEKKVIGRSSMDGQLGMGLGGLTPTRRQSLFPLTPPPPCDGSIGRF